MSVLSILSGAPLWVWPLLAFLVFAGLKSTRERTVPCAVVYALPLLGLLAVGELGSLAHPSLAYAAHAAAYALGLLAGFRLQGRWLLEKRGQSVRLAGEWLTLAIILVLFAANFANGATAAVSPAAHATMLFVAGFAVLTGLAAGMLAGRALRTALEPQTPVTA